MAKATNTTSRKSSTSGSTAAAKQNSMKTPKDDAEDAAKAALDQVKGAIPSMEDAASIAGDARDYIRDHANVDVRRMADDATEFVRRNPGASLAAAAGLGILIGILATKRS